MKFFAKLVTRITETPEIDPAKLDGVRPGERDTGVRLSSDLLRFYGLLDNVRAGTLKKLKEHHGDGGEEHEHDKGQCEAFGKEMAKATHELNDLTQVFWAAVRSEAGYPEEDTIGVRKGGVIVAFNERPRGHMITAVEIPVPGGLLRELLGIDMRGTI